MKAGQAELRLCDELSQGAGTLLGAFCLEDGARPGCPCASVNRGVTSAGLCSQVSAGDDVLCQHVLRLVAGLGVGPGPRAVRGALLAPTLSLAGNG